MDGGLSSNLPKFTDRQTITISPFSGEADISPEDGRAMFDWRVTLANQVVKVIIFIGSITLCRTGSIFILNFFGGYAC